MEKSVNKILVYTVIAILLGTVTMVVPLALLGPSNLIQDNDVLTSPEPSAEQSGGIEPYDSSSKESVGRESSLRETDVASDLSSIGLMTVPSFLVALGVFVYIKKQMI